MRLAVAGCCGSIWWLPFPFFNGRRKLSFAFSSNEPTLSGATRWGFLNNTLVWEWIIIQPCYPLDEDRAAGRRSSNFSFFLNIWLFFFSFFLLLFDVFLNRPARQLPPPFKDASADAWIAALRQILTPFFSRYKRNKKPRKWSYSTFFMAKVCLAYSPTSITPAAPLGAHIIRNFFIFSLFIFFFQKGDIIC